MALIFTPGQLRDRADFYQQTVSLLTAGYGLIQTLEHLRDRPPSRSFVRPLTSIIHHLQEGETFAQAIRNQGKWIPEFDAALLEAGELSGRIDHCLRLLANYYEERANLLRTMYGALVYPVLLLHAALVLIALPKLVLTFLGNENGDGVGMFFVRTLGVLIPIYVLVAVIVFFSQGSRARVIRQVIESVMNMIPIIGTARRHLALAKLAMALEALLNAGVLVSQSWTIAARASGSLRLERAVADWPEKIYAGAPPSELLRASPAFPDVFVNLYSSGESSGRTDEHLQRLHVYYLDSGTRKMRAVATWLPRLVYMGIVLYIAYFIISFYVGYFRTVGEVMNFNE
jgi:type II secretory pathway component PulF